MIKPISVDDQSYDQILESAKKAIRKYAPYWTDENAHDPGITLIEMMAWLKEMLQFYMDQSTESLERQFLRLLGKQTDLGRPATVVLQCPLSCSLETLPRGSRLSSGRFSFENSIDFPIEPIKIIDLLVDWEGQSRSVYQNVDSGLSIYPFGPEGKAGAGLYMVFDRAFKPEKPYYFYFKVAEEEQFKRNPILENDYFSPLCQLDWQYYGTHSQWEVEVLSDQTHGFLQSGLLCLKVHSGQTNALEMGPFTLKVNLGQGGYDLPPRIVNIYNRVVLAEQLKSLPLDPLKHQSDEDVRLQAQMTFDGTGLSGQVIRIPFEDVYFKTLRVEVNLSHSKDRAQWETWRSVEGFELTEGHSKCYVIDFEENALIFGDNHRGKIPPKGKDNIRITKLQQSFLDKGNIAVPYLELEEDRSRFTCLTTAGGGTAPKTVATLKKELSDTLQYPEVAVSAKDYESILKKTPGLLIRKIKCLPLYRPGLEEEEKAPNEVTVLVMPEGLGRHKCLSEGYKKNLKATIERHRLITTEVHVSSPQYFDIGIYCEVQSPLPDHVALERAEKAIKKLDNYDFGQMVRRSDIYRVLMDTEGIQMVGSIQLSALQDLEKNNLGDFYIPQGGIALIDHIEIHLLKV